MIGKRFIVLVAAEYRLRIGCTFSDRVSAIGIGLWWRQQTAGYALEWLQGQLQRQALLKHLEYLTKFANDIVLLMDKNGCIIEANDRAVATYGYPKDNLISLNVRKLRAPDTLSDFDDYWKKAYDEGVIFETVHCRADGSFFPVEVSSRRVEVEGEMWCQSIIRDISERKQAEQKIKSTYPALQCAEPDQPGDCSLPGPTGTV